MTPLGAVCFPVPLFPQADLPDDRALFYMAENQGDLMQEARRQDKLTAVMAGNGKTGRILLVFMVVTIVAIMLSGWREAVDGLSQLSIGKIAILCAMAALHYVIRAARWHMIVRAGGVPTTWRQNALHFFGGFAMTATPGRLGELVRLRWLGRDSGWHFGRLLPIVFADRAIELAAMVLLIALALLMTSLGTNAAWGLLAVATVVVWVACRPKVLERCLVGFWSLIGKRLARLFVKLRRMIRRLEPFMHMPILLPTVAIGVMGWALEGAAFFLLLDWLGAALPLWTAMAIFLVAILSGALSGLPGGLGGTEASAVALLVLQGVSIETALLATIIIRVTTLWFAVVIGLSVFPIAEARAGNALGATPKGVKP